MTLSEESTIASLIKARQVLDPCCHHRYCGYQLQETMLCLYASLDSLIQQTMLTDKEREIIGWYMQGCAAKEISETMGVSRQAVSKTMHKAVRKLVAQNHVEWLKCVGFHYIMTADAPPYLRRTHAA